MVEEEETGEMERDKDEEKKYKEGIGRRKRRSTRRLVITEVANIN